MTNEERIAQLEAELKKLKSSTTIPFDTGNAFKVRLGVVDVPAELASAPLASITAPSGGATVDSQARTAINTIITRLESLGLIEEN